MLYKVYKPQSFGLNVARHKAESTDFDMNSTKSKVCLATNPTFYCLTVIAVRTKVLLLFLLSNILQDISGLDLWL